MSNESADPDHYKHGGIECIDAMRSALGKEGFRHYLRGTILKYLWRLGHKDAPEMEAAKIKVYAGWLVNNENDDPLRKPCSINGCHQEVDSGNQSTGHSG